jgi:hypothetical protein
MQSQPKLKLRLVRCLGQRLLKIVFRMLTHKKPYDAERHALNQKKHAWVLTLAENPAPQTCK